MTTIDIPAILSKISSHCDTPVGMYGCAIWRGGTYDGFYGKMRNPLSFLMNQPEYMRVHRLVYLLHNITHFPALLLRREDSNGITLDVSHICHNTLCVNISHLVLEPHSVNLSRKICVNSHKCCHNHTPACLIGMLLVNIHNKTLLQMHTIYSSFR